MELCNFHSNQEYVWSGMCDYQTTHCFVYDVFLSWLFGQWLLKRYFIHIMIYHKYISVDNLMSENSNGMWLWLFEIDNMENIEMEFKQECLNEQVRETVL